jgi:endonuclease/exonuclease/phosphatase (EEP) superfamily protein YafD
MGFNVPWGALAQPKPRGRTLRIVEFNADGKTLKEPLERFFAKERPDIIVIPECRMLGTHGKHTTLAGFQGVRFEGVCLFSRFLLGKFAEKRPTGLDELGTEDGIALTTVESPDGPFQILALHLETVRKGLEALVRFEGPGRLVQLTELRRRQSQLALQYAQQAEAPVLVVGDLNLPVESRIYSEFWSRFGNGFTQCAGGMASRNTPAGMAFVSTTS